MAASAKFQRLTSHLTLSLTRNFCCTNASSIQASASTTPEIVKNVHTEDLEAASLKHEDYFGVREMFTVSDLFKARVHLGHKQGLRHEHMTPYIYGSRLGQDIIDLDQTAEHLSLALNVVAHLAYRHGILLFMCRNRQNAILVEEAAKSCGEFAHCRYWSGGLFTNSTLQYRSVTRLPDACIFFGTQNNVFSQHKAVTEAAKMQILSIGVVDTNSDPRLISYPIPGNDDSLSAVKLYTDLFKKAILAGKERRIKDESESR